MQTEDYIKLINEIIQKQSDILGPDIAIQKAKNVSGLFVSDTGEVEELKGEATAVLQDLVNEYIALSGQIVKNVLSPVFKKYPSVDLKLN